MGKIIGKLLKNKLINDTFHKIVGFKISGEDELTKIVENTTNKYLEGI